MPSAYAHYRMGSRVLPRLDPEIQACIRRNRHLYDLGLHGPDFLFFHRPVSQDRLYHQASFVHKSPGRVFFENAREQLRRSPSQKGLAYVYGVLAHFAVDSLCHPFINRKALEGIAGHTEMESEFDRWLLEQDGKPCTYPIAGHLRIDSPAEAAQIARFYEDLDPRMVRVCFRNYRFILNFCTAPEGLRRELIGRNAFGSLANEFMMTTTANLRCETLTPGIYARYRQAEEGFPALARQFQAFLTRGTPLGPEFDRDFG